MNNPLSFTDPSGFFFKKLRRAFKKAFKVAIAPFKFAIKANLKAARFILNSSIGRTVAAIGVSVYCQPCTAVGAGFLSGLIASGGDLKAGVIGALTAGAFNIVGHSEFFMSARNLPGGGTVLHGLVGGASSKLAGGNFRSGFLSGGFAKASSGFIDGNFKTLQGRVIAASVAGGAGAELGGGKFKNGALTGAFSRLFNDEAHRNDGSRIEMRRVGDRLFPVRVFQCATAECVAMGANLDLNDPGTQAFIEASDAKALSDLGTAASIVILKSPIGIVGNAAARTSLAADVAKTVVTGNPVSLIPAVTGKFAQGVAETSLGVNNAATINRIGAGTGLVVDQVINDE